ncbi:MAG: hypothetical protein CMD84_04580 [Gammaproteobacteria bacterium]|nr:hypothetical protein [Gammaproteobacteria bacterium]
MLTIDLIITLFIIFWTLYGFLRGFITELTSLLCWSAAIYFSANYFYIPANHINEFVNSSEISNVLAFIGIFMFTFIFSSIIGFILSKFVNLVGFSTLNKILGLIVGLLKGMTLTLITVYLLNLTEFRNNNIFQESKYMPFFNGIISKYLKSSDSFFDSLELNI